MPDGTSSKFHWTAQPINFKGDWTSLRTDKSDFCQLSQRVTDRVFLLVRGTAVEACQRPVASRDAPCVSPKSSGGKQKYLFRREKILMSFFVVQLMQKKCHPVLVKLLLLLHLH